MKTARVITLADAQAVKLPDEFRFDTDTVSVRRDGEAIILEPAMATTWPKGFFEDIRIDDPAFGRADQGETPPAPTLY